MTLPKHFEAMRSGLASVSPESAKQFEVFGDLKDCLAVMDVLWEQANYSLCHSEASVTALILSIRDKASEAIAKVEAMGDER
jgi:hypothetical protein